MWLHFEFLWLFGALSNQSAASESSDSLVFIYFDLLEALEQLLAASEVFSLLEDLSLARCTPLGLARRPVRSSFDNPLNVLAPPYIYRNIFFLKLVGLVFDN